MTIRGSVPVIAIGHRVGDCRVPGHLGGRRAIAAGVPASPNWHRVRRVSDAPLRSPARTPRYVPVYAFPFSLPAALGSEPDGVSIAGHIPISHTPCRAEVSLVVQRVQLDGCRQDWYGIRVPHLGDQDSAFEFRRRPFPRRRPDRVDGRTCKACSSFPSPCKSHARLGRLAGRRPAPRRIPGRTRGVPPQWPAS